VFSSKLFFTSTGSGAPPDKQNFSEDKSYLLRRGELFIAL